MKLPVLIKELRPYALEKNVVNKRLAIFTIVWRLFVLCSLAIKLYFIRCLICNYNIHPRNYTIINSPLMFTNT